MNATQAYKASYAFLSIKYVVIKYIFFQCESSYDARTLLRITSKKFIIAHLITPRYYQNYIPHILWWINHYSNNKKTCIIRNTSWTLRNRKKLKAQTRRISWLFLFQRTHDSYFSFLSLDINLVKDYDNWICSCHRIFFFFNSRDISVEYIIQKSSVKVFKTNNTILTSSFLLSCK